MLIPNYFAEMDNNMGKIKDNENQISTTKMLIERLKGNSFPDPFFFLKNSNSISVAKKKVKNYEENNIQLKKENETDIPRKICKIIGNSIVLYHQHKTEREERIKYLKSVSICAASSTFLFIVYKVVRSHYKLSP